MSNPLYSLFQNQSHLPMPDFLQKFLQFKNSFSGDPKQQVQQMLNNGQMTQEQFNQLAQTATQIQKELKL